MNFACTQPPGPFLEGIHHPPTTTDLPPNPLQEGARSSRANESDGGPFQEGVRVGVGVSFLEGAAVSLIRTR